MNMHARTHPPHTKIHTHTDMNAPIMCVRCWFYKWSYHISQMKTIIWTDRPDVLFCKQIIIPKQPVLQMTKYCSVTELFSLR